MNENYENYETMEEVEVECPVYVEYGEESNRNDLMIGVGIGVVAAMLAEHVIVPFVIKPISNKLRGKKIPKFHVRR